MFWCEGFRKKVNQVFVYWHIFGLPGASVTELVWVFCDRSGAIGKKKSQSENGI